MQDAHHTLVSLLLPAGMLDYFALVKVEQTPQGLNLYLEEKNIAPAGFENQPLESKGFLPQVEVQDFPIRGQQVALQVKRRRWQLKESQQTITRDWELVQRGTRMTGEFAAFLKAAFR